MKEETLQNDKENDVAVPTAKPSQKEETLQNDKENDVAVPTAKPSQWDVTHQMKLNAAAEAARKSLDWKTRNDRWYKDIKNRKRMRNRDRKQQQKEDKKKQEDKKSPPPHMEDKMSSEEF